MKSKNLIFLLTLLLLVTCLARSASALPGSGALWGWEPASVSFNFLDNGRVLAGEVEFAVYDAYPGTAPSGGTYVYAYQISNAELSTVSIDSFSAGIYEGAVLGGIGTDNYEVVDGVEPSFAYFSPDAQNAQSAIFLFLPQLDALLASGQNSTTLLFSSEGPPTTGFGIVEGGSLAQPIEGLPTPAPTPEPATILLLGAGGALISLTRKRTLV